MCLNWFDIYIVNPSILRNDHESLNSFSLNYFEIKPIANIHFGWKFCSLLLNIVTVFMVCLKRGNKSFGTFIRCSANKIDLFLTILTDDLYTITQRYTVHTYHQWNKWFCVQKIAQYIQILSLFSFFCFDFFFFVFVSQKTVNFMTHHNKKNEPQIPVQTKVNQWTIKITIRSFFSWWFAQLCKATATTNSQKKVELCVYCQMFAISVCFSFCLSCLLAYFYWCVCVVCCVYSVLYLILFAFVCQSFIHFIASACIVRWFWVYVCVIFWIYRTHDIDISSLWFLFSNTELSQSGWSCSHYWNWKKEKSKENLSSRALL